MANCTASCDDLGRGVCSFSASYNTFVCECSSGYARDTMHLWNIPISCTTKRPLQLFLDFMCLLVCLSAIALCIMQYKKSMERANNQSLKILIILNCSVAFVHILFDALRLASIDFSIVGSILFSLIIIGSVQLYRLNILYLADKAFILLHEDVTKISGFVTYYAKVVAWTSKLMDAVGLIMVFATFLSVDGYLRMDIEALNEGSIFVMVFCAIGINITAINAIVFLRVFLKLINKDVCVEMTEPQLKEFRRRANVMVFLLKKLCQGLCAVSIAITTGYGLLFKTYVLDGGELPLAWIIFTGTQIGTAGDIINLAILLPKYSALDVQGEKFKKDTILSTS